MDEAKKRQRFVCLSDNRGRARGSRVVQVYTPLVGKAAVKSRLKLAHQAVGVVVTREKMSSMMPSARLSIRTCGARTQRAV